MAKDFFKSTIQLHCNWIDLHQIDVWQALNYKIIINQNEEEGLELKYLKNGLPFLKSATYKC